MHICELRIFSNVLGLECCGGINLFYTRCLKSLQCLGITDFDKKQVFF